MMDYVENKVKTLFEEIVKECDLKSGDVTPSQVDFIAKFEFELCNFIKNNQIKENGN
jgi:hypothetical protein